MPSSRRSSPSAEMDDAAAAHAADGLHPSPPRSKKRSSRPSSGGRSPNPNPRPRADYYGIVPSRKSERKRKPRAFPDVALLSRAIATRASPSRGGGGAVQLWTDADELALLTGALSFRTGSGRAPRRQDTGPLFESIRDSLSPFIDQDKLYYKLKRLKSKFCNTALSANSTPHDRRVRDLSADLWRPDVALAPPPPPPLPADDDAEDEAEDEEEEEEEEDPDEGFTRADVAVGVRLPLVSDLLGDYWKRNAGTLSGISLEKGLALVGANEGMVAEAKWRRHLDAEMRSQVRRHDLAKEVLGLLIDTVKGLGP